MSQQRFWYWAVGFAPDLPWQRKGRHAGSPWSLPGDAHTWAMYFGVRETTIEYNRVPRYMMRWRQGYGYSVHRDHVDDVRRLLLVQGAVSKLAHAGAQ